MKRETVRRLGGFALAAVLAAASIQPVMAEDVISEVQNTEASVQTGEAEDVAADGQRAEEKKPSLTADSVVCDGMLKVPVDLGDFSAKEVTIQVTIGSRTLGFSPLRYENGFAECGFEIFLLAFKGDEWFTKAGEYEATITFLLKGHDEVLSKEKGIIRVLEDSKMWQVEKEIKSFDGSQDVIFTFKSGTNCFELQSVQMITLQGGYDETGGIPVGMSIGEDGFTCDLKEGIITINKEALQKELASRIIYEGSVMPDKLTVSLWAIATSGIKGWFPGGESWELDISKWKAAQNETPNETPNESEMTFGDVSTDHWYYDYVKYVYDRGLMTGLNENDFGAVQSLARAQFAVILYRMEGEPKVEYKDVFPDVADGQWYTDAIMWANQAGIVTGYTDSGLFGFADDINREQMAVMMHRYAEYKGFDISKKADFNAFSDAASVNEFADEAMQWAVGTGIISGKDEGTRIDPQGDAARAECATIIQRFVTAYGM